MYISFITSQPYTDLWSYTRSTWSLLIFNWLLALNKIELLSILITFWYFSDIIITEKINGEVNNFPQVLRSNGPNHLFEIFVPSSTNEKLPNTNFFDISKNPVFKLEPRKKKIKSKPETVITERPSKARNLIGTKKKKVGRSRGRTIQIHSEEPKVSKTCQGLSLENCVDNCTSISDIFKYSGCVVTCAESCN